MFWVENMYGWTVFFLVPKKMWHKISKKININISKPLLAEASSAFPCAFFVRLDSGLHVCTFGETSCIFLRVWLPWWEDSSNKTNQKQQPKTYQNQTSTCIISCSRLVDEVSTHTPCKNLKMQGMLTRHVSQPKVMKPAAEHSWPCESTGCGFFRLCFGLP